MKQYEYLQDKDFLLYLTKQKNKKSYIKINVLDWQEKFVEAIEGRVQSGSLNIDGSSAVRRTMSITFLCDNAENDFTHIKRTLSIDRKINAEIGFENTTNQYPQYPIIWFPLGIYVITAPSISHSYEGIKVNLSLQDKMALLNGECGGVIPAQTQLDEYDSENLEGLKEVEKPTIYQIIQELVHHFGGEQLDNIVIDDLETRVRRVQAWNGDSPLYHYHTGKAEPETHIYTTDYNEMYQLLFPSDIGDEPPASADFEITVGADEKIPTLTEHLPNNEMHSGTWNTETSTIDEVYAGVLNSQREERWRTRYEYVHNTDSSLELPIDLDTWKAEYYDLWSLVQNNIWYSQYNKTDNISDEDHATYKVMFLYQYEAEYMLSLYDGTPLTFEDVTYKYKKFLEELEISDAELYDGQFDFQEDARLLLKLRSVSFLPFIGEFIGVYTEQINHAFSHLYNPLSQYIDLGETPEQNFIELLDEHGAFYGEDYWKYFNTSFNLINQSDVNNQIPWNDKSNPKHTSYLIDYNNRVLDYVTLLAESVNQQTDRHIPLSLLLEANEGYDNVNSGGEHTIYNFAVPVLNKDTKETEKMLLPYVGMLFDPEYNSSYKGLRSAEYKEKYKKRVEDFKERFPKDIYPGAYNTDGKPIFVKNGNIAYRHYLLHTYVTNKLGYPNVKSGGRSTTEQKWMDKLIKSEIDDIKKKFTNTKVKSYKATGGLYDIVVECMNEWKEKRADAYSCFQAYLSVCEVLQGRRAESSKKNQKVCGVTNPPDGKVREENHYQVNWNTKKGSIFTDKYHTDLFKTNVTNKFDYKYYYNWYAELKETDPAIGHTKEWCLNEAQTKEANKKIKAKVGTGFGKHKRKVTYKAGVPYRYYHYWHWHYKDLHSIYDALVGWADKFIKEYNDEAGYCYERLKKYIKYNDIMMDLYPRDSLKFNIPENTLQYLINADETPKYFTNGCVRLDEADGYEKYKEVFYYMSNAILALLLLLKEKYDHELIHNGLYGTTDIEFDADNYYQQYKDLYSQIIKTYRSWTSTITTYTQNLMDAINKETSYIVADVNKYCNDLQEKMGKLLYSAHMLNTNYRTEDGQLTEEEQEYWNTVKDFIKHTDHIQRLDEAQQEQEESWEQYINPQTEDDWKELNLEVGDDEGLNKVVEYIVNNSDLTDEDKKKYSNTIIKVKTAYRQLQNAQNDYESATKNVLSPYGNIIEGNTIYHLRKDLKNNLTQLREASLLWEAVWSYNKCKNYKYKITDGKISIINSSGKYIYIQFPPENSEYSDKFKVNHHSDLPKTYGKYIKDIPLPNFISNTSGDKFLAMTKTRWKSLQSNINAYQDSLLYDMGLDTFQKIANQYFLVEEGVKEIQGLIDGYTKHREDIRLKYEAVLKAAIEKYFNQMERLKQTISRTYTTSVLVATPTIEDFLNSMVNAGYDTYQAGDLIGYTYTDFYYPSEFTVEAGSTVVDALDTIKNLLGNYEFYYDVNGKFHFKEIKNYLNTSQSTFVANQLREGKDITNDCYLIDFTDGKAVYNFEDSELLISATNNPQYGNIKNDFIVWGARNIAGSAYPIRFHLAIDEKPILRDDETYDIYHYYDKSDGMTKVIIPVSVESEDNLEKNSSIVFKIGDTLYRWSSSKQEYLTYDITELNHNSSLNPINWRDKLYLMGVEANNSGVDAGYYYAELVNEWPKLYSTEAQIYREDAIKHPENLDYFLDFIDSGAAISEYSVKNIGRRTKVVTDDNVNCMFAPECPDVVFIKSGVPNIEELRKEASDHGYSYYQMDDDMYSKIIMGQGFYSAYDKVKELLYQYTNYNEAITLEMIPMFFIEPNIRISVKDSQADIYGDYVINNISVAFDNGSNMTMNCTRALQQL